MQGIGDEPTHIAEPERRQHDLLHRRSRFPNSFELAPERMRGIDLVVAVGADQQQVLHVRLRQPILKQIEGAGIEPLQIVQEQRQRMVRLGEDAEEAPEDQLEPALRLLRRQFWNRRLFADDELQFGNEVNHELAVRAESRQQGVAPGRQLAIALRQKSPDQALKSLCECRIWDVALELVELAGREQTARRHQHLVQLTDDGRLADAGIAGDQNQLRHAARDHAAEGGEQNVDFRLSPIQLLGDEEPVGCVVGAGWKGVDATLSLPLG